MAHIGEECRLGFVGVLRRGERVPEGLSAVGQLLLLEPLPLQRLFQLLAVFLLLILHDEAVQQAGAQHIPDGIERQQRIEDLHRDQQHHGDPEQADGAVPELHLAGSL